MNVSSRLRRAGVVRRYGRSSGFQTLNLTVDLSKTATSLPSIPNYFVQEHGGEGKIKLVDRILRTASATVRIPATRVAGR